MNLRRLLTQSIAILALTTIAPAQRIQWTRQHGTNRVDNGNAVGYGEFGAYVAGDTVGTFQGQDSAGGKDAFLTLHDEAGNLKWVRQFGTSGEDVATGVAGDGSGAYVVGHTRGALPQQAQVGNVDSFIRKYDSDGNIIWTRQFGSTTDDFANAVATHTSGVYVVGRIDCCAGSLPGLPPTASADAYIRKYSGDGDVLWTRYISTTDAENAMGVAVDSTGGMSQARRTELWSDPPGNATVSFASSRTTEPPCGPASSVLATPPLA